jgi:AraC family transcriptional regulator of adaptative response / DNA-3-methyladenine glycosylase II
LHELRACNAALAREHKFAYNTGMHPTDSTAQRALQPEASPDGGYNGRYVTAVKASGIYCVPGCLARKGKPEHIEYFGTPAQARAAGYRPCKQCRPDDFYPAHNGDETLLEGLAGAMRADPARFEHAGALASAAGLDEQRLHELFREYYHATPAAMLERARVTAAQRALLEGDATTGAIAADAGFESALAFEQQFRRYAALAPGDYRQLRQAVHFTLDLPPGYPAERMLRHLGRDPGSLTEQVAGQSWSSTLRLPSGRGALIQVAIGGSAAACRVLRPADPQPAEMARIHAHVLARLGLSSDPGPFEAQLAQAPQLERLIEGQRGLRISLIGDHFDGLTWAIVGQQISLPFAYTLRRRLIERASQPVGDGMFLPAAPEAVAQLSVDELAALSFSRSKASYLIGAAQAVVDGRLPLAQLSGQPATRIERLLLELRGIGPWSAQYVLMRSYGFLDCVPVGDAGLNASLQQFFQLPARPDARATLVLMEPFRPYRSLATYHLWQRLTTPA